MSKKELDRLSIMEKLVERRLTQQEAAMMLSVTDRQIRRLLTSYRSEGRMGLISKKRGRLGNRAFNPVVRTEALNIIEQYYGLL